MELEESNFNGSPPPPPAELAMTGELVECLELSESEQIAIAAEVNGELALTSTLTDTAGIPIMEIESLEPQSVQGSASTPVESIVTGNPEELVLDIPEIKSTSDTTPPESIVPDVAARSNELPMEIVIPETEDISTRQLESNDDSTIKSDESSAKDVPYYWEYDLRTPKSEICLASSIKSEFQGVEYMRGCKWAPDGSCLLTNSDDFKMRIFNLPNNFYNMEGEWDTFEAHDNEWASALKIKEGGLVFDYCWYPLMHSSDPISACFLTTAANAPTHLWDAFTGQLRCSYRAYDQFDEVTAANCVAFDPTGQNIYCGFDTCIRIFNIARPGREYIERKLKYPHFSSYNQTGIISCIAANPTKPALYACGSYNKTIGLYMEDGTVLCILEGHYGGLTHLKFSQDGTKLFSGGRKDSRLICWDIRNLGDEYQIFNRDVETNQRIYFDTTMNDKFLVSGGTKGNVLVWDLLTNTENQSSGNATWEFQASTDCVNGVSLNPLIPVLATASGQRHFQVVAEDSDEEMFVESPSISRKEYDVRLWKFL